MGAEEEIVLEFRWNWAGHVSKKVLRAETMEELMAKVSASLRDDCAVRTPTATLTPTSSGGRTD